MTASVDELVNSIQVISQSSGEARMQADETTEMEKEGRVTVGDGRQGFECAGDTGSRRDGPLSAQYDAPETTLAPAVDRPDVAEVDERWVL